MPAHVDPTLANDLADKLFAAVRANDLEALRSEVYSPDIQVWHNSDRHAQDLEENLKVLGWIHRRMPERSYEDVRRHPTPTGLVEQHVFRGRTASGIDIDVPACLVITVTGSRISRIEEYIDSAHIAPISQ